MKYKLIHSTLYEYRQSASSYHSIACLCPRTMVNQVCGDFSLTITPEPAELTERLDFFGNAVHYFSIQKPHKQLRVVARSTVETIFLNPELPIVKSATCRETRVAFQADLGLKSEVLQYLLPSPFVQWDEDIRRYARECFAEEKPLYEAVRDFCRKIFREFAFDSRFSTVNTPLKMVLREKKGVCQDFSHLVIAGLRSLGFAARYVSGYLETLPPPGQQKLQGSDASHAWISAYVPGLGWCDFDPTNDTVPRGRHLTTAWGRDYGDVPPLKGILSGSGRQRLRVEVDVLPILE